MWHRLNIRTRILLGYGLILAFVLAMALFVAVRINHLNRQIREVNASVALEATIGAQLATEATLAQQWVDRYLQQPNDESLQQARAALQQLQDDSAAAQARIDNPEHLNRLIELDDELQLYMRTFNVLNRLIEQQESLSAEFSTSLASANAVLSAAAVGYLAAEPVDRPAIEQLLAAQSNVQTASLLFTEMSGDNREDVAPNIIDQLSQAIQNLRTLEANQPESTDLQHAITNLESASSLARRLHLNHAEVERSLTTLIDQRTEELKQQYNTIAKAALSNLLNATNDLERQIQNIQRVAGAILIIAVVLAVVVGLRLAQTITHPLHNLVVATQRLHEGDFDVVVPQTDDSEIGRLGAAFNRMIAALAEQRAQLVHEQERTAARNRELEQALADLRAATEAREALATTVRALSVPVVPILDRVIVLPLVGAIDDERAETFMQQLLDGVTKHRARIAILDITGVPLVDSSVVNWLLKAIASARLLGARCVLVGVGPEVAQAIVSSGIDMQHITAMADLRSAVEYALRTDQRHASTSQHAMVLTTAPLSQVRPSALLPASRNGSSPE